MSIFPKKLTHGETCIIHLNFASKIPRNKVIQYFLKVYNPKGKIIYNISKYTILVGNNEDFERQLYYPIHIGNSFLSGKYIVEFFFYIDGNKIISRTIDNDYFIVEKITHSINIENGDRSIYLKNESSENIDFDLIYEEGKKYEIKHQFLEANGSSEYPVLKENVYIKYENGKLEKIYSSFESDVYFRKPTLKWKDENSSVIIKFDDEKIELKNEEVMIWKELNGFLTLDEIVEKNKLDKN